jgi:hypothetical protein
MEDQLMKHKLPPLLVSAGGPGADGGQMQVRTGRGVGRDEAIIGSSTTFEGEERERVGEVFTRVSELSTK